MARFPFVPLLLLLAAAVSRADPVHPIGGDAYWHHYSGWIFPNRIGDFVRVGVPQDVGGSEE